MNNYRQSLKWLLYAAALTIVAAGCAAPAQQPEASLVPVSTARDRVPAWICDKRLTGWVDLEFTVMPDGQVQGMKVIDASPRHVFEAVAADSAERWHYAPQASARRIRQRINFDGSDCEPATLVTKEQDCPRHYPYGDGRQVRPLPLPTEWPAPGSQVRTLAEIQKTFDMNRAPFEDIRRRELAMNPCLSGELVVGVWIAADGSVAGARPLYNDLTSPRVEDEALDALRGINFGAAQGSGAYLLQYPLFFQPDDAPQQIVTSFEPMHSEGANPHGWRTTYLQGLTQQVAKNLRYPPEAQRKAEQGKTVVRVRIARNGAILSVQLAQKSGFPELDAEARNVFERIVQLPPVPDDTYPEAAYFEFTLPLNFALK